MQNVEVINKSSIISLPELFYREDTHPTPSPTNSVSKLSEMYTMFVYPYTNAQFSSQYTYSVLAYVVRKQQEKCPCSWVPA